jgi:hypothetical protein
MIERRSWISMEDGIRLAASLFLPESVEGGEAAPVVLETLPYCKDGATASYRPEYERLYSEFGYAVPGSTCGEGVVGGVACCWPIHMQMYTNVCARVWYEALGVGGTPRHPLHDRLAMVESRQTAGSRLPEPIGLD